MTLEQIVERLSQRIVTEKDISDILNDMLHHFHFMPYFYFDGPIWKVELHCGNDLSYYGSGDSLASALKDAISDYRSSH